MTFWDDMKKLSPYAIILLVIALFWLPTGLSDSVIAPFLIGTFGFQKYILIGIFLLLLALFNEEIRNFISKQLGR